MPGADSPAAVKSALRTLDILEHLVAEARPLAANEIAATLAIPVSSLSYLLATLAERGYVERVGRRYAPGAALARLRVADGERSLAERVRPLVRAIRRELDETAGFFVRRGFSIEAVASEIGEHALRYTLEVGRRAPMHAFAAGKALLAALEEDELREYLERAPREAFTANTVVDEAPLRAELARIRAEGVAHTREEHTPGIVGIGRAVVKDGAVLGAFSVAMPLARFDAAVEARAIAALGTATDGLA